MDFKVYQEQTWQQFGASIHAMRTAIEACPDTLWGDLEENLDFWYNAYHALFWLDAYLEPQYTDNFRPPEPFGMEEADPSGALPPRVYTKAELLAYLDHGYKKCKETIFSLTEESAQQHFKLSRVDLARSELMLYSMRHMQHHTGQLNYMIRKHGGKPPGWSFQADRLKGNVPD